jgi:hypothetical protein
MGKKRQQSAPVPKLTDERLCWIAVRDHVAKKSSKVGLFGWFAALGGAGGGARTSSGSRASGMRNPAGLGGDMRRDAMTDSAMDYAIAVDEAAEQLTPMERDHLRATGEVPDWFLADIDRRAEIVRRQRS